MLLRTLGADIGEAEVSFPDTIRASVARFPEGEVVLLPSARPRIQGRRIIGATVRVRSIDALRRMLVARGMLTSEVISHQHSVFLPPSLVHGLWLEFRESR